MTPKAQPIMINEVKKIPKVTAKGLKESLELVNISVYEVTIHKTGWCPRQDTMKFAKEHPTILLGKCFVD